MKVFDDNVTPGVIAFELGGYIFELSQDRHISKQYKCVKFMR